MMAERGLRGRSCLQKWPQDLPRGGAKQTRGTKRGRGTLSVVANNS